MQENIYRADNITAAFLMENGLTQLRENGFRRFKLKPNGKRWIQFSEGAIQDNIAKVNLAQLSDIQLVLLTALHIMHPISRKELIRYAGPDLNNIQALLNEMEAEESKENYCSKLRANVAATLAGIQSSKKAS